MIFFLSYFKKLLFIVDKKISDIFIILIISFISVSVDLIGFSIILPFISLIVSPEKKVVLGDNYLLNYLNISSENESFFFLLSIVLIIVFFFKAIIAVVSRVIIIGFAYKQLAKLQTQLMSKYHGMSYLEYLKNSNSYYLRNIRDLSKNCIDALESSLKIITETLVVIIILIYLVKLNFFALIILGLVILSLAITYNLIFKPISINFGKKVSESYKRIFQLINESISGFKEIKINNKKDFFIKQIKKNADSIYLTTVKNYFIIVSPRYIFEVSIVIFVISFIYISLNYLNIGNNIIPIIGVFAMACLRLVPSMTSILNDFTQLNFSKFAIDTCFNDIKNINKIEINQKHINFSPFENITFKDVSFKYPSSKLKILNKLNFEIIKNDCVAIIGASGSGKTTLIDIFLGLLNPTTGEILLNGKNLPKNTNILSILSAYLPQETLILEDSIKNNISLETDEDKIDLDLINISLEKANLKTFIDTLPDGIETKIGEGSFRLSGGQKQRLAIARNFYLKKEIIVMDEATSSLDEKNENRIIDSLKNLRGKKTIILITHKLKLLKHFEKVYSIKNGILSKIKNEQH
jgi:ABC-type multidrug transport system fused ATPase/permease subunit